MASKIETISYSELDTFRQCPLKHNLGYVQRWKKEETSPALARGTAWHAALEAHYLAIRDVQRERGDQPHPLMLAEIPRAQDAAYEAAMGAIKGSGLETDQMDLLVWMYAGYVEQWGIDPEWWIVAVEYKEEIVLPNPSGGRSRFRLKTKIDLIIRDLSLQGYPVRIVDHKSGSNLPSQKELDIDDQFGLYVFALRTAGKAVLGTVYNAARTQRNKGPMALVDRMGRYASTRSDQELREIGRDAYLAAAASRTKANLENPYSSPNPDQCKWKCDFLSAHMASRKSGADITRILAGTGYTQDFTRH